jgi:NTE family protein
MGLAGAIFNAARHTMDYDFIRRNPDYRHLVTWIPAVGFNWLDFNMDESTRAKLFLEGAREAIRFLERFNWEQYKQIRRGIASANVANETPGVEAPERRVTAAG